MLQIARPHVLDEKEACAAARAQRGSYPLYLRRRESEGVALHAFGRFVWSPAFFLELESEQRADDRAQLLALVVKREYISRLGILAYEQKVQDANGLVALQPLELVHDPALELRIRGEADRHELNRPYFLCHRSPPSVVHRVTLLLPPPCPGRSLPCFPAFTLPRGSGRVGCS